MNHKIHDPATRLDRQEDTHGVVVGVDGSKRSLAAATWALREAERTSNPLTLVSAYSLPVFPSIAMETGQTNFEDSALSDAASQILQATVKELGETSVEIRTAVELGDPATVLVEYSKNAELLVAGPRGRGGFLGLLIGSVSRGLPAHSDCPVVLVPKGGEVSRAGQGAPVVVGADGSEQGRYAMLRAAEEAERRNAPLRLVTAMAPVNAAIEWLPSTVDESAFINEVKEKLEAGHSWLAHYFPKLDITSEVIEGVPVDVMVKESASARLLVVGTRGLGGFVGALLGSTSQGIVSHAKGPVMVVQHQDDERLSSREEFGPVIPQDFDGPA